MAVHGLASASMTDLAMLLTVQELDNTAGALRHRLATLPERRTLDEAQAAVHRLGAERAWLAGDDDLAEVSELLGEPGVVPARDETHADST